MFVRGVYRKQSSAFNSRAFSLMEALICILVLGLISALAVPVFSRVVDAGRLSAAVTRAETVNTARASYALTVSSAQTNWSNAASDTDRIGLLIAAGLLDGAPSQYLSSAGGYTMQLGSQVRGKTTVMLGGTTVAY